MHHTHQIHKNYYELYAKLLLENSLPDTFSDLAHQDKPDLLCEKKDIGIEVSRALFPYDGEASGIMDRYKGKSIHDVKPSAIELMNKMGYKLFTYNDIVVGYAPLEASWVTINPLKKVFNAKIRKLQEYEKHFENNLFIFSPSFKEYDLNHIFEFGYWVKQEQKGYAFTFDRIYLFDSPILHQCDFRADKILSYKFPDSVLDQLCLKALEMSK